MEFSFDSIRKKGEEGRGHEGGGRDVVLFKNFDLLSPLSLKIYF